MNDALVDLSGKAIKAEQPIQRVIETEEQAREFQDELKNIEDPKRRRLEAQRVIGQSLDQLDQVWKTLSRKRRRQVIDPKQIFSQRVKRIIK